jgi:hypothetical protein
MAAHVVTSYLKLDKAVPYPCDAAVWVGNVENATPFEESKQAHRVRASVPGASGVVRGADCYWYVMRVWSVADVNGR